MASPGYKSWQLSNPTTGQTYVFEISPEQGKNNAEPVYERKIPFAERPQGKPLIILGQQEPKKGKVDGVSLSQSQYNALWSFANAGVPVVLTDDLGRSQTILITDFQAKRAWKFDDNAQWYNEWSMQYLVQSLTDI